MFEVEKINKQKKQTNENIQLCAIFFYISEISEPLNLSDSMMNLIEDFNILQFCWNLNLLLP